MIETKEQYEQAQFVGDREFAHKVMDGQGLAWTVEAIFDLRETIEALREVARAGRLLERDMPRAEIEIARESWGNTNANLVLLRHSALSEALIALPDWLIEE